MFYSKEYLEQWADKINKEYYPDRLERIIKLDPYDFMEKLGLDYEWKYISPNMKLLGMIFFEDGSWFIWDNGSYKTGYIPHIELFKKGTIVINEILMNKKYKEKELFICGHEIMHWIKDQEYFKNHTTDIIHACKEEVFEKTWWNNGMDNIDIIERQTNYLNAAVLMPRDVIKREFFKILKWSFIPDKPIKYEKYMIRAIKALADGYGLNLNPVKYRLFDLKILERYYD